MNSLKRLVYSGILAVLMAPAAHAVTLIDHDDWKVLMTGFIETDVIKDSTRSFNEVVGNGAVQKSGTLKGDNGRLAFSDRNSRLAFAVLPPAQNDWKTKGYFEFDFLGYEPDVYNGTPSVSEAGYYSNPAIRIRHAFFNAEHNGWTYLVGQSWSLFGWQANYVPTTVSVAPGPGILYQRNLQLTLMKAFAGDSGTLQTAVSVARPTQRDSQVPNIDVGARYAFANRKSGFASASGDAKAEPMSIGLSGTFRQFETAMTGSATTGFDHTNSSAGAVDVLVPILAADDKDISNTLTLTAEYSAGTGYGDELPSWSGGTAAMTGGGGGGPSTFTNLDAGIGGYETASGAFSLIHLETMSAQLQYHFAAETGMFMTVGYSEVHSNNIDTAGYGGTYDRSKMTYVNLFKDLTAQIRVAAEYQNIQTHYIADDTQPFNDRYQLSAYFRF